MRACRKFWRRVTRIMKDQKGTAGIFVEVARRSLATHLWEAKTHSHDSWLTFHVLIFVTAALHVPLAASTPLISGFQTTAFTIIIIIQSLGWEMKSITSCAHCPDKKEKDLLVQVWEPWVIPALPGPAAPNLDPQRFPLPHTFDRISASKTTKQHHHHFSFLLPAQMFCLRVQNQGTSGMHLWKRKQADPQLLELVLETRVEGTFALIKSVGKLHLSWNGNSKHLVITSFSYIPAPFFPPGKNK